ncbi:type I-F CRISPR-associated endoribonuclease Cas6/Csy4 [uncultured Megasphaera sp.]|uniref:type I-F CRISPR-associated endoribonuclease Cas6/Csy4 n=1 Tax=uncultured Megasphaera sp. TaxID=165188 RepID=UPI0025ECA2D4|nr:type I-F CRISPR-associated endoribonuclease Cas6/Csy4 [uncultured Megasphaera sp.]
MMFYQEITLYPSAEIPTSFLMTKVFMPLHFALASQKEKLGEGRIGISFPQYTEESLGNKVRIFSKEREILESADIPQALRFLQDYIHLTAIREVAAPRIKGYAVYRRYQPDSSRFRKAKRYAKRNGISYEKAFKLMKTKKPRRLPYVQLKSKTTQQKFSLFIEKIEAPACEGNFNAYGLSQQATVPEF